MDKLESLPDGHYFDGRFVWQKDGTEWSVAEGQFGDPAPTPPVDARRLRRAVPAASGPTQNRLEDVE